MKGQQQILRTNKQGNSSRATKCVIFDPNNTQYNHHTGCIHVLEYQDGYATQHLQLVYRSYSEGRYLPFGELFVEQRTNANYTTPYKFSGKEKDEETSYSDFGARYYLSDISIWASVDPMKVKCPIIYYYH